MAFSKYLGQWLGTVGLPLILSIPTWSPSSDIRCWMVSVRSSVCSYLDCLSWCDSVNHSVPSVVIFSLVLWRNSVVVLRWCRIQFRTVLVAIFTFIQNVSWNALVAILYSFGIDRAHLTYHISPVCLLVSWTSAEWYKAYHHRLRCAFSGSPLGVLAITWLGALIIILYLCSGASFLHYLYGNCLQLALHFRYGHLPFLKVVAPLVTKPIRLRREYWMERHHSGLTPNTFCSHQLPS